MTIGQMVQNYCDRERITYSEFGELVGMTTHAVSKLMWEPNKLPNIPLIKNIAKVLGMTYMGMIHEHFSTWEGDDNGKVFRTTASGGRSGTDDSGIHR